MKKQPKNFGKKPDERQAKHTLTKLLNGWPMQCPKCKGPDVYEKHVMAHGCPFIKYKWACSCGHTWSRRDANSGASKRKAR